MPSEPAGLALAVSDGVARAAPDPDSAIDALATGWNDAGFELLRRLPDQENVVFSPASIGHALLMAAAAGDEVTSAAIEAGSRTSPTTGSTAVPTSSTPRPRSQSIAPPGASSP